MQAFKPNFQFISKCRVKRNHDSIRKHSDKPRILDTVQNGLNFKKFRNSIKEEQNKTNVSPPQKKKHTQKTG